MSSDPRTETDVDLCPDLTGTWSGEFLVCSGGVGADGPGVVNFKLSWMQRGVQLFGYVRQNANAEDVADRGRVRGRLRRRRVAFVQELPARYVVDASGTARPLTELVESLLPGARPLAGPQQLFFAGSVAAGREDVVRGVFHVPPLRLEVNGERVDSDLGQVSGRFTMWRESHRASRV